MGTPRLYYYPDGGSALETIDLAEELTNIEEMPFVRREDAEAMSGAMSTAILGPMWSVRITLERFGSPGANAIERQLQALLSHLRLGGRCGVSRDHSKSFCALRSGATGRGWSYVPTGGNGFAAWSVAAAIGAGDEVAIEQAAPGLCSEIRISSGMTGNTVNLSEPTVYEMDGTKGAVWVRWRDFWPVCYMSAEDAKTNPLTHDHRRNYTLNLRLYMAPGEVATVLGADLYESQREYNRIGPMAVPTLLGSATVANAVPTSLEAALRRSSPVGLRK